MHRYILQRVRDRLLDLLLAVPQWWREDSPGLPDATQGMQIPLRPSPVAQKGRWLLHGLLGVYLAQLVLLGHLLVAGMVAVLAGALVWQCRCHRSSAQPALRLLLAADGRIHLLEADGTVEPATLQPCSMRLGLWLLLVLRADTGTRRLLLGPDNVDPVQLAALRRRMAAVAHRPGGTR
ncbi:MAG: hypothetical protein M3Y79_01925 [Pseudomonadota bacterium]|nr:hypothetical protein [Pseudomonadota bacterium]